MRIVPPYQGGIQGGRNEGRCSHVIASKAHGPQPVGFSLPPLSRNNVPCATALRAVLFQQTCATALKQWGGRRFYATEQTNISRQHHHRRHYEWFTLATPNPRRRNDDNTIEPQNDHRPLLRQHRRTSRPASSHRLRPQTRLRIR